MKNEASKSLWTQWQHSSTKEWLNTARQVLKDAGVTEQDMRGYTESAHDRVEDIVRALWMENKRLTEQDSLRQFLVDNVSSLTFNNDTEKLTVPVTLLNIKAMREFEQILSDLTETGDMDSGESNCDSESTLEKDADGNEVKMQRKSGTQH